MLWATYFFHENSFQGISDSVGEEMETDLEIRVESDDAGGREGQRQAEAEREPVPVLGEDHEADDGRHVGVAGARLQRDRHVTSAGVDDALRQDRAQFRHHVFVLVGDHLVVHGV